MEKHNEGRSLKTPNTPEMKSFVGDPDAVIDSLAQQSESDRLSMQKHADLIVASRTRHKVIVKTAS